MDGVTATVLARLALGFLLASAGAVSLVVAALYRGRSALALTAFGLFSWSYGSLVQLQVPLVSRVLDLSPRTLGFLIFSISYAVPGLGMFYAEQIRGRGWHSLLRRAWQVGLPLAVAFTAFDLVSGRPGAAFRFYEVYLAAALLVLLPHVILFQHRDRVERLARAIGTGLLAVTLLIDILSRLLSWRGGFDTYGIAAFVLAQGVVTGRRFFADQRELAVVERELEMARAIQTAILPRDVPAVAGLRIAMRYLPARTVAGDLYDFVVDNGRLGVLVADVAGHGMSAALIASMTTVAFASQKPHASDTARTLAEMNRVLCGHFDSRFVTAAYLFLDVERRRLRYSLAGHPPPILWRAGPRRMEVLSEGSIVLGVLEDAAFEATDIAVDRGDRLIIYTDGLAEVQTPTGEWFGDHELVRAVHRHVDKDADRFCDAIVADLAAWSGTDGTRFADDLTLVVIDC